MPTQRNFLINTTTISTTASGTTIVSGNTQSATFVVALTLVRSGIAAGEFASGSQTWSIHYVVSAMTTPYELRLKVQRRNSSGTMQAESGYTTVRTATGTYDDNLTADLGTWAASDQLALVWEHRRPSGSGNKNATIDANGSSYIDAPTPPLDLPKTAADDVNNLTDAQGLGYGNLHIDSINNLADTAQITLGLSLAANDNAGNLADGAVKVVGFWTTTADSLQSLTDALAHLLTYQLSLADSEAANWADSHNLLLAQFLALADSSIPVDAATVTLAHLKVLADAIAFLDSVEQRVGTTFELEDNVDTLSDSIELLLAHHLTLNDVNQPAFPSTLILDDFNRADEGPPPSANWSTGITSDFGVSFSFGHRVLDNELYNATETVAQNYWNVETFGPDCEAYVTTVNTADAPSTWLVGRLVDPNLSTCTGYTVRIVPSNAGNDRLYSIHRIDDSLLTLIASTSETGVGSADGDKYGIQIIGNVIYLWGDTGDGWEVKLSVSDSTYNSAGFIGIVTEAATLSPRWDDFGGGTVVSGLVDAFSYELSTGPSLSLELSDPLASLVDSFTLGHGLLPVDTLGSLTDALALRGDSQLAAAGALTLNDSETHVIGLLLAFAETISLDDSLSSGHGLICADSFALSDTVAIRLDYLISTDDSLTLADSESHSLDHLVVITDNLNLLADSIAPQLGQRVDLADLLLSFTDSHTLEPDHRFSFSDTISLTDDYADDLINTVEGTTEELADDINLLADGLSLGVGLALVDNAANLTDTETHTLGQLLTLTDSVANFNDEIALRLHKSLDFSDSLTLTDSESATLGQYESLTDAIVTFVDAATIQLDQQLTFADSINNLADASTQVVGFQLNFSDVLPLTDTAQLDYGLGLTDDIDMLVDSIITSAPQGPLRQVGVTDALTEFGDEIALQLGHFLDVVDAISLTDSIAITEGILATLDDALSLTDAIITALGQLLSLADTVSFDDSTRLQIGYQLDLADVVVLADAVVLIVSYDLALADSTDNLSDVVELALGYYTMFSDSLTLTDGLAILTSHHQSLADALAFADSVQLQLGYELTISDVVTLTDTASLSEGQRLTLSDNVANWVDSAVFTIGLALILNDNAVILTDTYAALFTYALRLTDSLALTDALTTFGENFLQIADEIVLSDDVDIELRGPDREVATEDALTLADVIVISLGNELRYQLVLVDTITLTDHYFDLRHPYTPSPKRHIVVPSRARMTTVPERQRVTVVPARDRTTRVE